MIKATNYNILEKEKSNIIQLKEDRTLFFGVWISGGWAFQKYIDHRKLKMAIESSLNAMPWISARITDCSSTGFTLDCNNQGVRLDIVCHPDFSTNPNDGEKYTNLIKSIYPYNRNIYFTKDKPHIVVNKKQYEQIPIVSIQLNYGNTENIENLNFNDIQYDGGGCIITFKLWHGFGDGYTGYYYMRYISDYLEYGPDHEIMQKYKDIKYQPSVTLSDDEIQIKKEQFKDPNIFDKQYNIGKDGYGEVTPYFGVYKNNKLYEIISKIAIKLTPYIVGSGMDSFGLRFRKKDIEAIKYDIITGCDNDDDKEKLKRISTLEAIWSYLSIKIASYESSTGKLNKLTFPLNLRNRSPNWDDNTLGNGLRILEVGIPEHKKHNASNLALELNNCLNIYVRSSQQEKTALTEKIHKHLDDFYVMKVLFDQKYAFLNVGNILRNENVFWNEFRSLKLYDNYQFGTHIKPSYYLYGTHFTTNRFMVLQAQNNTDEIIVFTRLPKAASNKFRQNEAEFFETHEITPHNWNL